MTDNIMIKYKLLTPMEAIEKLRENEGPVMGLFDSRCNMRVTGELDAVCIGAGNTSWFMCDREEYDTFEILVDDEL